MIDILHLVGIKSQSPARVDDALTTLGGLNGWWSSDTRGDAKLGGTLEFWFGDKHVDMKVAELEPGKRVVWEVVGAQGAWKDTKVTFDLKQEGDYTRIFFGHRGWREPSEMMHHCTTKWASFLFSLKALLETGKGAPFPNDVRIISDAH